MKFLSTVLLIAFAVWLSWEFNTRIQIKTHVDWTEPNFESLIESLAQCRTHADKYPEDCGRHEEARRTVITAYRSCKAQPTQPACVRIKANITQQQALFDQLVRLSPAFNGFVIPFKSYWSPDNDWLHETWGSADRWLAIRSAYDTYTLGVWLAVLALLAARSFWFDFSAQREANRKWRRLQTDSLRAAEQERLLEIEISVRKEQEESARRRLRQAEQARQIRLALEKVEADRLVVEEAARAEKRNQMLAERELARAKLERFQSEEAAAAIAAAIARRRGGKKKFSRQRASKRWSTYTTVGD